MSLPLVAASADQRLFHSGPEIHNLGVVPAIGLAEAGVRQLQLSTDFLQLGEFAVTSLVVAKLENVILLRVDQGIGRSRFKWWFAPVQANAGGLNLPRNGSVFDRSIRPPILIQAQ